MLENHWNGDPLLTIGHALGMAGSMTYKGVHPSVSLHAGGTKGTRLPPKAMKVLERGLERLEGLGKWFVKFVPAKVSAALKCLVESGF